MKRLACILLSIVLLTSCAPAVTSQIEDRYEGVVDWEADLSYMTLRDFEVDEELAMSIGKTLLTRRFPKLIAEHDDIYFMVYELSGKDIFIVSLLYNPGKPVNDRNVAISKIDGRVLGFFQGD